MSKQTCDCRKSDAWQCANDRNITTVACRCDCHKPPRKCTKCGKLTAPKALRLVVGGSSSARLGEEWCQDCIAANEA